MTSAQLWDGRSWEAERPGQVRLCDADSGRVEQVLEGHWGAVWSVAFAPDGKLLASGGHDGTVRVWNATSGQAVATLQGHRGTVWCVRFAPDGRTLASASEDGSVKLWDVTSTGANLVFRERPTRSGNREAVVGVAFTDGQRTPPPAATASASASGDHG
jgi:WD40 repeat protein